MDPDQNSTSKFEIPPIARLIQLGREKSFITYQDILSVFPYPELDVEELDRIFAALICAKIPYGDAQETALEIK